MKYVHKEIFNQLKRKISFYILEINNKYWLNKPIKTNKRDITYHLRYNSCEISVATVLITNGWENDALKMYLWSAVFVLDCRN
jgi:hypothetical protein